MHERTQTSEGEVSEPSAGGAHACLVIVLDGDKPLAASSRHSLAGVREVVVGRAEARNWRREPERLFLGVADARASQRHARMVLQQGVWSIEDTGSKNGLVVDGARVDRSELRDGAVVEIGHTSIAFRQYAASVDGFPPDVDASQLAAPAPGLVTFVPSLVRAFRRMAQIATTTTPLLLQGETGTGKEVAARAIHLVAARSGPFVAVNCGALPSTLVESELFGYRRGAFSGATEDRTGLVRSADTGTLFLDEIGDLSLASQTALLRVLQEREVTPLGTTRPVRVDVKVVAATHRDLKAMVAQDTFRRDLYARIAGFTVDLPPLRERREDLGILLATVLRRAAEGRADTIRFGGEAARALLRHDWPLNIRELESCIGVAAGLADDGTINVDDLPPELARPVIPQAQQAPAIAATGDAGFRDQFEALLREHRGNISAVARATGVSRIQVHRWLKRYQLDPAQFRR